ncbi:MAG: SDR family oxidoreductase [Alphaproteobacteria bacterium]
MTLNVLFIGGTGQISLSCVEAAVAAGHRVTVYNRGTTAATLPDGVATVGGDLNDDSQYRAEAAKRYDVVCQFIAFTAEQVRRDLAVFRGQTAQYVFISSASAYKKPVDVWPITEDVPLVNPYWEYSRRKAEAEAAIVGQDAVPYTIVRPSHTVRTQLPTALSERDHAATRMRLSLPVIVPGDGTSLWTLTRSEDLAVPFVGLFGKPAALGEAFHITSDRAFTWDQIYAAIGRGVGAQPDIVHVPTDSLVRFDPEWTGPLLGDKVHSVVFDNSKVRAVAGDFACAESLDAILAEPLRCYRQRTAGVAPARIALDDKLDVIVAAQRAVGA